jgi:hypothetical protein
MPVSPSQTARIARFEPAELPVMNSRLGPAPYSAAWARTQATALRTSATWPASVTCGCSR